MQHQDDAPRIPTITAEEAMKLSWTWSTAQTLKAVSDLYQALLKIPQPVDDCGSLTVMSQFAALWNAGRVQGIREERARRKRKTLTAEQ